MKSIFVLAILISFNFAQAQETKCIETKKCVKNLGGCAIYKPAYGWEWTFDALVRLTYDCISPNGVVNQIKQEKLESFNGNVTGYYEEAEEVCKWKQTNLKELLGLCT